MGSILGSIAAMCIMWSGIYVISGTLTEYSLEICEATSLFKKGKATDPNNYRFINETGPISNLKNVTFQSLNVVHISPDIPSIINALLPGTIVFHILHLLHKVSSRQVRSQTFDCQCGKSVDISSSKQTICYETCHRYKFDEHNASAGNGGHRVPTRQEFKHPLNQPIGFLHAD